MAISQDKSAPYAPPAAVMELVQRFRDRGLSTPIDADVLARAGISDSLIPRTLYALHVLDLVDDSGMPTVILDSLRTAGEDEFKASLVNWLDTAYAEVRTFVDPALDDETKVRDAFRVYKPFGQQPRMVRLFMGLYAAAGIASDKHLPASKTRKAPTKRRPNIEKTSRSAVSNGLEKSGVNRQGDVPDLFGQKVVSPTVLPAPIAGLLLSLPSEGAVWPNQKREAFLRAFSTLLEFCYPATNDAEPEDDSA